MTTVTDEGRRLLEGASIAIPWRVVTLPAERGGIKTLVTDHVEEEGVCPAREPDAALIVYAVNYLPAFLAAVEVMQRLVATIEDYAEDPRSLTPIYRARDAARAALAPFTEEPTDGRD